MTLNNALNIGASALIAQSIKIDSISDNISNVNTVGYKGFTTDFLSLVYGNSTPIFDSRSGARPNSHQYTSLQGEISPSDQTTDIAINGQGLFAVTADTTVGSKLLYTRAGTFSPDKDGNLRNSSGFYLQGWKLDSTGALPASLQTAGYDSGTAISSLELVNVATADSLATPTTTMSIKANLNAAQTLYNPAGKFTFAANPTAGDTITINGVVWTFVASGATGNQTNIGADLDHTVTNLADDLTASTNPAITPGTYTNVGGNKLNIVYDSTNGAAATFTLASSSVNATPTQLLLYNSALATNNMSGGAIAPHFNRAVKIVDNNGIEHTVNINFLKTAINSWAVELTSVPTTGVSNPNGQIATGTMTFNGDGSLATLSPSLTSPITFQWSSTGTVPTGATTATTNNPVTFGWGTAGPIFGTIGATIVGKTDGMHQFTGDYVVDNLTQDGHATGTLQKIQIADNGIVTGYYSNGATQSLFKIPLAKFNNPDGLESLSGTVFADSETSGFINLFASGDGGAGNILSDSLENANVDLASQLTDIIIAQRAYQSNTKTVSTSDDMLKTVTDMLR